MPKGFFITGTDTGVGKTVIAGAIIRVLRMQGIRPAAMKPIETGCGRVGTALRPSDGIFLKQVSGMEEPVHHITPFCFETPVAPLVASETEGKGIDISVVREAYTSLSGKYQSVIMEGVGGIFVPLRKDYFVIDLIREVDLPIIVVTKPSLGTINHTLLTVNYALEAGLTVTGIIVNFSNPPDGGIAEMTNPGVLEKLSPVPLIGTFPHLEAISDEALERAALKYLDIGLLLK